MQPLYQDRDPYCHCQNLPDLPVWLPMRYWDHQKTDGNEQHDRRQEQPELGDEQEQI
jgi:hypothetical protein